MSVRMRAEVRDKWADALESGKYTQTTDVLHRPGGGFCCLGVFCDLAVKAGVIDAPEVTDIDDEGRQAFSYGDEGDSSYTGLPHAVIRWAGLYDDDEEALGPLSDPWLYDAFGVGRAAATWNDGHGATFPEIAAMVRAIPAVDEP